MIPTTRRCDECSRKNTGCLMYVLNLPVDELHAWCLERKHEARLSNQQIADISNISKRTVDRFFAEDVRDIRLSSFQPILAALLRDCFDCRVTDTETEKKLAEYATQKKTIAAQRKIIIGLSVLVTLCILIIGTALIVDKLNGNIGFFWLDSSVKKMLSNGQSFIA